MGRFTAYDQNGRMISDFDKSDYDFLLRYGRTPEEVLDENAKLREELAKAYDPQRIGGQADPESFVYAIEQLREFRWQHATNDEDAIPYINKVAEAHERENAKLRQENQSIGMAAYELGRSSLADENAKLRELAEKAWKAAEMLCQDFDGPCRDDGVTIYKPCPLGERDELCVYGLIQRDLRELGVEVDDGN